MIHPVYGIELDGTCVTTTFGRTEIPSLNANYADSLETEAVTEMGSQAIVGRTPGTYKIDTIKIKFRSSIFRGVLMPLFPSNGAGNARVAIVVGYVHPDLGADSDMLMGCRCTNWSQAAENSNKALEVETSWEATQIFWTNARKTINRFNRTAPIGRARF